jgi:hypothetical protein
MDTPDRKPIEADAQETLVTAARRFLSLHPDVQAVGLTVISRTVDPRALSTIIVGAEGPIQTPDVWILSSIRFMDASAYCNENAKALLLGLAELANNMARSVEGMRNESERGQPGETQGSADRTTAENSGR